MKYRFRISLLILMILVLFRLSLSGQDSVYRTKADTKRLAFTLSAGAAAYTVSIAGLYSLWYKDYPHSSFHFFNDNREWFGLDKSGHMLTSYYLGSMGYEIAAWSGVKKKAAIWYGGLTGMVYLTTVEVFDGFSAQWGASPGDLIANATGSALFIGQQLLWDEQRILLKWSYHPTGFPEYNPSLLGKNSLQQAVKDYNGHTCWLSVNPASFLNRDSRFPKWLNVAVGYGADGMIGAASNPERINGNPIPYFERKRMLYLAPDIDLSRINVKSKAVKWLFKGISFLKIPAPTLEFDKNKVKLHVLYF